MNQVKQATSIICDQLGERMDKEAAVTIAYHVQTYGAAAVGKLAAEAQATFSNGGLRTAAGEQRTMGGCYFYLAKKRGWVTNRRHAARLLAGG